MLYLSKSETSDLDGALFFLPGRFAPRLLARHAAGNERSVGPPKRRVRNHGRGPGDLPC
jgi:hypothetical protein